jgi:hypothetical protein
MMITSVKGWGFVLFPSLYFSRLGGMFDIIIIIIIFFLSLRFYCFTFIFI